MEAMYEGQLLSSTLGFSEAVANGNVADMAAFYVEQKAYKDIVDHTRDLLTGGDGYQCWLSVDKKKQQHSFSKGTSAGSYSRPVAAVQDMHKHRASSPHARANSPVHATAVATSPGSQPATTSPVSQPATTSPVCLRRAASPENSLRTATAAVYQQPEIEPLPDFQYASGVPTGAEYLVCNAAASAARQKILNQVKLRQQLLNAQRRRMLINPPAISKAASQYKDKITQPFKRLAASLGHLTLAQKRTYADNHSTSQWTREPSHCGRRGLLRIRKQDILNPWDQKPTSKVPGGDAYSRKAPCAPQIAPSTLQAAKADAAAEARSGSLAAAKLRAAAAERYAGQRVPRGRGHMHKLLYRGSTLLGVWAARMGLLKPQMQNTVAVPARPGTGAYLKPSRVADNDAVQAGSWSGPRSEASCMRMDELRLLWQLEQLTKQEKRLKAQLAVAKMGGFFGRAVSSSTSQSDTPTAVQALQQQLHMTASSIHFSQHILHQLQQSRNKNTASLRTTLDQCISVAYPPEDLWDDTCYDSAPESAEPDGSAIIQLVPSQEKASQAEPSSNTTVQCCTEIKEEYCTELTATVPEEHAATKAIEALRQRAEKGSLQPSMGRQILLKLQGRLSRRKFGTQATTLGSAEDDIMKRYGRRRRK